MKKHEYLKIDKPIPGQTYALVSFVEPRNKSIVRRLETFYASRFLEWWVSHYKNTQNWISENPNKEVTEEMKEHTDTSLETIENSYNTWLSCNEIETLQEFQLKHNQKDEVVIKGFKVRGVYSTEEEAREACKDLHIQEPFVNIYVTTVGKWIPLKEDCSNVKNIDYGHDKLNEILKEKTLSGEAKKLDFEKRVSQTG